MGRPPTGQRTAIAVVLPRGVLLGEMYGAAT
jgi:hypothetical protein